MTLCWRFTGAASSTRKRASEADDEYVSQQEVIEPSGVVMPGFVDTHSHVGAHIFGTVCDDENIITAPV